MKMQLKRIVSAVCAVALCASVVTTPVLAIDGGNTGDSNAQVTIQSESNASTGTPVETPAPAEQTVNSEPTKDSTPVESENTQEVPADTEAAIVTDGDQPTSDTNDMPEEPGMVDLSGGVSTFSLNNDVEPLGGHGGSGSPDNGNDYYVWNVATITPKSDANNSGAYTLGPANNDGVNTPDNVSVYVSDTNDADTTWKEIDPGDANSENKYSNQYVKIEAADGYYIQYLVVACNDNRDSNYSDGFNCQSVGNGHALTAAKDVGTDKIILDTKNSDFYHGGMDSPYHILIQLAKSPNPVFVVYEAGKAVTDGDVANALENEETTIVSSSDFAQANVAVSGTSVAFAYPSVDGKTPSTYVLPPQRTTVTVNNKVYQFDGWAVTYYNDTVDELKNAFNMSSPSNTFTGGTISADQVGKSTINLFTHVKLVAQWTSSHVSVTKTITKVERNGVEVIPMPEKVEVGDTVTYTITVKNTGDTALSNLTVTDTFEGTDSPAGDFNWEKKQDSGEATYKYVCESTVASLAVNEERTFTYTYTVPAADKGKTISNTVVVSGDTINPVEDEESVQVADDAPVVPANDVNINKTASEELVDNEADVTLSIGASESKDKVAVLFLLDKSTSQKMRDEAAEMLLELKTKDKVDILYDVVIFSGTATATGWLNIQDSETLEDTLENFVNGKTSSGTNMDAGIEKALSEMNDLPEDYKNAATYLVTLSDGITYVWSEDGKVKSVPVQSMGNNGNVEVQAAVDVSTWEMLYRKGASLYDLYRGDTVSQTIEAFKNAVVGKMNNTREKGHVQGYDSKANPVTTYVYNLEEKAKVAATYACGSDFAMYESVTGYEELVKLFDYSFAYAVPEFDDDSGNDKMSNWEFYPWGKEIMLYMHSLSTDANESGEVSNADAEEMFSSIKNRILYAIEEGTVTDVIGEDFDLKVAEKFEDSFTLTVGDVEQIATYGGDNIVYFGTKDSADVYPYVVTYYPKGNSENPQEHFVWEINTPVQNIAPLQLTYKVKLVNAPTEIGEYNLPTNEEATLEYTSTNGGTGSKDFPVPKVPYSVIRVSPAGLTIYMGGDDGYESIVDDSGGIERSASLPEPGFYLELPKSVNDKIREALNELDSNNVINNDDIIDLSNYVRLSATATDKETGNTQRLSWKLERYGYGDGENETSASHISGTNHFIYKIKPQGTGVPVRVKVTSYKQGSDEFKATEALFDTYDMEIYGDGVDAGSLQATIEIKDENNNVIYSQSFALAKSNTAELTVRYVTGEQNNVVTDALHDISEAEDPSKAYVVLKDLKDSKAEHFIINEAVEGTAGKTLTVQADPGSVDLLFDDIVSADDTNDNETKFEETLVDNAVEATDHTFQNLQYQAKYLDLVDANNGNAWLTITEGEKVTVYWPYPEGTNADTKFYLQHFKGIDRDGTLGAITQEVEKAEPVKVTVYTDANGIYFETDSFSPYVLLWDKTTPTVDDGGKEETSTPASTPSPTAAPAKATQPVAAPVAAVIPQTGDDSQPILWVALVGISGVALAALAVYRKKRSDK